MVVAIRRGQDVGATGLRKFPRASTSKVIAVDHAVPAPLPGRLQVSLGPGEQARGRLAVSREGDGARADGHQLERGAGLESKLQPSYGRAHALGDSHGLQMVRVKEENAHALREGPH